MSCTPEFPLFQGQRDIAFQRRMNRSYYSRFMIDIPVFKYDQDQEDELYGEDIDKSFNLAKSDPSYMVKMFFPELPVWGPDGTKHGLDERRRLEAISFLDVYEEMGVARPINGDHIEVNGERYKIMDSDPTDYWGNTQEAITLILVCQRVRAESIEAKPRPRSADELYPASVFDTATDAPAGRRVGPQEPTYPGNQSTLLGDYDLGDEEMGGDP